jgi:superfamily II DNA/RNA helicase
MGKNLVKGAAKVDLDGAIDLGKSKKFEFFIEDELTKDQPLLNPDKLKWIEDSMTSQKIKVENSRSKLGGRKNKKAEAKYVPKMEGIQTIVCSATLTLDAKGRIKNAKKKQGKNSKAEDFDALEQICKKLRFKQKCPKVINLTNELKMPDLLVETYHRCQTVDKDLYSFYFLQNHSNESTIVFANSITCVKRLSSLLTVLNLPHNVLHSKMQQRQRLKNFERFKRDVQIISGKEKQEEGKEVKNAILVCTDVAARGLDIPNVRNVVHYQMPINAELYLHRCGRTARIGKGGLSFALFAPEDEKRFRLIYKVLKQTDNILELHTHIKPMKVDLMELQKYKGYIRTARDLEKAVFSKKKTSARIKWIQKMAEETGIAISDELKEELEALREALRDPEKTKRERKEDEEQNGKRKREKKELAKSIGELKKDFHDHKKYKDLACVSSRSSFLNPTNVKYLNRVLFENQPATNHELNKNILVDYLRADNDKKFKRKKSKVRHIKRHSKQRKRPLAKK